MKIKEIMKEFDERFDNTLDFYNETDVGGLILESENYIKEIDKEGVKAFIADIIRKAQEAIVPVVRGEGFPPEVYYLLDQAHANIEAFHDTCPLPNKEQE